MVISITVAYVCTNAVNGIELLLNKTIPLQIRPFINYPIDQL